MGLIGNPVPALLSSGVFWGGRGGEKLKNHCTSLNFSDRKALVLWSYCLSSTASPFQLFFCSVWDMMMHKTYFQHQSGEDAKHTAVFTHSSTEFLELLCFILKTTRTANTSEPKGWPGLFSSDRIQKVHPEILHCTYSSIQ